MKKERKKYRINSNSAERLEDNTMKQIYGSGNRQVRFLPDEYVQAKILSERGFRLDGR